MRLSTTLPAIFVALAIALPTSALAEKKSPLDGQPAVRQRLLLVKHRFEATAAFESTVNADFKHTLGFGAKLEYHLSDMLSIGGVGFFGVPLNTELTDRIVTSLPDPGTVPMGDPTPSKAQFREHLNTMPVHGAAFVGVTPWYGKLAAFGKFFVNFDFYFQGGVAFASLKNKCCSFMQDPTPGGDLEADPPVFADNSPNNDPALNDGTRIGLYVGGGIHVFVNDFIALDLTVRDYIFSDNPSGLDFNADLAVLSNDNRVMSHLFMGIGISVLLPFKAARTE